MVGVGVDRSRQEQDELSRALAHPDNRTQQQYYIISERVDLPVATPEDDSTVYAPTRGSNTEKLPNEQKIYPGQNSQINKFYNKKINHKNLIT